MRQTGLLVAICMFGFAFFCVMLGPDPVQIDYAMPDIVMLPMLIATVVVCGIGAFLYGANNRKMRR